MAKKRIKSRPGLFGTVYYYDENGKPIGKSRPDILDTRVYFDEKGRFAGRSRPGFFAKEVFRGTDSELLTSYESFGGERCFKNGKCAGYTRQGLWGFTHIFLEEPDEACDGEQFEEETFSEE